MDKFTKWDQLPTSELVDIMRDYFESLKGDYGSIKGFIEFAENNGIDMTNISNSEVNRIWDLAGEDEEDEDEAPIIIDDMEICDRYDANKWLQSKLKEYGNTYHFSGADKLALNKLIDRFGNTYFWDK